MWDKLQNYKVSVILEIILIGLLVFVLSTPKYEIQTTQYGLQDSGENLEIANGKSCEIEFTNETSNLVGLQLVPRIEEEDLTGTVQFRLLYEGKELQVKEVSLAEVEQSTIYNVLFDKVKNAKNKTYTIQIGLKDSTKKQALLLALADKQLENIKTVSEDGTISNSLVHELIYEKKKYNHIWEIIYAFALVVTVQTVEYQGEKEIKKQKRSKKK